MKVTSFALLFLSAQLHFLSVSTRTEKGGHSEIHLAAKAGVRRPTGGVSRADKRVPTGLKPLQFSSGSHDEYEYDPLMGCCAVYSSRNGLTFQRSL
jgi:hypothetical protein